uniref:Large ribosomal subunit protein uL24c n=1 Tax=Spyridia filamentosa TaxID=196632 RepID=A0A1Z1MK53_SPYFI|nr:ribosomal protein L24 [Spyridia filamentosa]ARW66259.1 ribosomal protein L24 [Spyridia filamentosa]
MINNKKNKICIKKGDNVKIISGINKNKTGIISKVLVKKNKVIISNMCLQTKHIKPKREGEKGQIIQQEAPIHISNIQVNN